VIWVPTIVILDSKGRERYRIEGYLSREEFEAQLDMAVARIAFKEMRWQKAERLYERVVERHSKTSAAPEALYWRAVSRYKGTNDHSVLGQAAEELQKSAPESIWTKKATPWLGR
jgi:outer membrane protein assembly factor BamD (BamD/ComL family)